MRRVYRAFLRLYPAEYRAAFGAEMLAAFDEADQEHRGRCGVLRFLTREIAGLVRGLSGEWLMRLRGGPATVERPLDLPSTIDLPAELVQAQRQLRLVLNRMEYAIAHHDFPSARRFAYAEQQTRENLRELFRKYNLHEQVL